MTIKFIVAHRMDENNVGDLASEPLQYFLNDDEYQRIDVANLGSYSYDESIPLIVGGGGLLCNEFMGDFYNDLLLSSDHAQLTRMWGDSWQVSNLKYKEVFHEFHEQYQSLIQKTLEKVEGKVGPRFIWGAGHNSSDISTEFRKIKWPKAMARYDAVGIRDYDETSKFEWVPCASCMHPAFDKEYEIKNKVIFFEHKKQLLKPAEFGDTPFPRFVNSGHNFDQTIELLGSAEVILTNSYHGAYWGMLLGRKVAVVGPWSSKFNFFKHPPYIMQKKENYKDFIDSMEIYPDMIQECRNANIKFWEKVKSAVE
jgi:hypothetical protein